MVDVELHGILTEKIRKSKWKLAVNSVAEAVRAIESNTKQLHKAFVELDKQNIKYRILINKKDFKRFKSEEDIKENPSKEEKIKQQVEIALNSNLITSYTEEDLKSIDIIPVLEGSGDFVGAVLGIVLTIVSVALLMVPGTQLLGAALLIAGIGLTATGFLSLMSSPPPYVAPEFASPNVAGSKGGGGKSYLFDGPTNTAGEGGPIPIGYGRLLVGSKTVSASYNTSYVPNNVNQRTT